MTPPLFYLRYDGITTMIHGDGYPIGEYRPDAYQIWPRSGPSRTTPIREHSEDRAAWQDAWPRSCPSRATPIREQSGHLAAWQDFCRAVMDTHGYSVPGLAAPTDLHPFIGVVPDKPVAIPLAYLEEEDPFARNVWCRDPYDRISVERCIAKGHLASVFIPVPERDLPLPPGWDAQRIAHFVVHPDPTPVQIQVVSTHGHVEIEDGWHRLAAAFYRGDATIPAHVTGEPTGREFAFPTEHCRTIAGQP